VFQKTDTACHSLYRYNINEKIKMESQSHQQQLEYTNTRENGKNKLRKIANRNSSEIVKKNPKE
jgi:hypothetical protein